MLSSGVDPVRPQADVANTDRTNRTVFFALVIVIMEIDRPVTEGVYPRGIQTLLTRVY